MNIGANFQALSGLPFDRTLTVALAQGSRNIAVDPRGTYRATSLNLLSLRGDKSFRFNGSPRVVHRRAAQRAEFERRPEQLRRVDTGFARSRRSTRARLTTSYFGRVQEIVAPRVLKIGFKFDF